MLNVRFAFFEICHCPEFLLTFLELQGKKLQLRQNFKVEPRLMTLRSVLFPRQKSWPPKIFLRSSRGICSRLTSTWCKMRKVKVAARGNILAISERKKREKNNMSPKEKFLRELCSLFLREMLSLYSYHRKKDKEVAIYVNFMCDVKVLSLVYLWKTVINLIVTIIHSVSPSFVFN